MSAAIDPMRLTGFAAVTATTLELFGLPLQPIIWGLIGGIIGSGWAKPTGALAGIGIYLSASLMSALCGHAFASYYGLGSIVGNAVSAVISTFFHPILAAGYVRVPAAFDAIIGAIGSRRQP